MSQIISDVMIKKVAAGKMISILVTGSYEKMGDAINQLAEWLEQKNITPSGPIFSIFYDTIIKPKGKDVKFEVCVPVDRVIEGEDIIKYREDIEQDMVAVTYRGSYDNINIAYDAISDWMGRYGYIVDGASREVYIVNPLSEKNVAPESFVTEILFPIKKK